MKNLKKLRKSRGLSLKELGEILGVAESTVSLYENGKREASYSILKRLSAIFDVSIDFLLSNNTSEISPTGNVNIPILNSVSFTENEVIYNLSDDKEAILMGNPSEYFYFKMHDSSMEGQISKGDVALIKKQDNVQSGDIAAVICEGTPIMLKRVIFKDSFIILESFNPKFPGIFISQNDSFTVLGKVVQTIKKW